MSWQSAFCMSRVGKGNKIVEKEKNPGEGEKIGGGQEALMREAADGRTGETTPVGRVEG